VTAPTSKKCTVCKAEKPLEQFHRKKGARLGRYSQCKPCCKVIQDKIRKESTTLKERSKAYAKTYATKHHAKKLEAQRKWRQANKEKQNKLIAKWKKLNAHKSRHYTNQRRARKLQAIPPWFEKEKVDLVYKKAKEWGFVVDHVIPLLGKNVCGLHCWANLQLLDAELNGKKGNRHYPDH